MKENPIIPKKTMCSICGFSLNFEEESWYDFVVECEHLFLRNIYSEEELKKKKKIQHTNEYREILDRFLEVYPMLENVLEDGDISEGFKNFLVEDFDDSYPTLLDLKSDVEHINIPKKKFCSKKVVFSDKIIAFLYLNLVRFTVTDKIKGIPI